MNLVTLTTIILVFSAVSMIALERLYPYRKGLPLFREGFWVDMVWYTIIQSYFLKILIFDFIIYPIDLHYGLSRLQLITHWPLWAQLLLFFVTHDFYIYWFHRWQHSNKWLWRTHEAHHSGKEIDWISGSRSHIAEIIINQTIEFAPIILLGAGPEIVPIKALIDAVWGMYIHSNINVKSGKLQYIINGPEMHLWHHANHQEVFYANYSTKLAIWDWMFGTAYLPENAKPKDWGLPYAYPKDYFLHHFFSIKRIDERKLLKYHTFRKYHTLRPSLMSFIFKSKRGTQKMQQYDSNCKSVI